MDAKTNGALVVDDAMVERTIDSVATALYGPPPPPGSNSLTRCMSEPVVRRAVLAALTPESAP